MTELMDAMMTQMETVPKAVQYWMNWMLIIFFASLAFVYKYKAARYVLGAFLLTIPIGFLLFHLTGNIHLLGIAHVFVWAPLLAFLYKSEFKSGAVNLKSVYGIWLQLLSATIVISLLFDIRDIVLVLMGH